MLALFQLIYDLFCPKRERKRKEKKKHCLSAAILRVTVCDVTNKAVICDRPVHYVMSHFLSQFYLLRVNQYSRAAGAKIRSENKKSNKN